MSIFKQPSLPGVPLRNLGFSFDRFNSAIPYRYVPSSGFVRGMVGGFDGKGLSDLWSHMFIFGKELELDLEHNRGVGTRTCFLSRTCSEGIPWGISTRPFGQQGMNTPRAEIPSLGFIQ